MRYAERVERFAGEGAEAWAIHMEGLTRRARGEDIILLTVGDTDTNTPTGVIRTATDAMLSGDTKYTPIIGFTELREAVAKRSAAKLGVPIEAERVVITAGAQGALYATAQCLFDPGDEVVAFEPMYVTYEAVVRSTGAELVPTPCPAALNFHPDLEALAARITPKTKAILFATPNNPTGAVLTRFELEAIAELCRKHDLWCISDEVYGDIVYQGEHLSPLSLPGMADRTVVISSLSKSHAMTGWRIGWSIVPDSDFADHLFNLLLCSLYGLPGFSQRAAISALTQNFPELAGMMDTYRDRRRRLSERLDGLPGMACHAPEGGMFLLLDVRGSGLSAQVFAERLLAEAGVALLPADAFGASAKGHLRLSLGTTDERLDEAALRIKGFATALTRAA